MLRAVTLSGCIALALGPTGSQSRRVDLEAADCSRYNNTYSDSNDRVYETARAVQRGTVPVSIGRLDVRPGGNGGVSIEGGSGGEYSITACVSAGARDFSDAQAAADSVQLRIEGSRVSVTAPDDSRLRNWSVHLVIETPRNADVSVDTQNGPISLDRVSGRFDVRAQNGPVSIRGGEGEIDAETQNGPVSIALVGRRWDGHLHARANNGPVSVHVPDDFISGVEVSSSHASPWSCAGTSCGGSRRDWDDRARSLRIGADPVVVTVSTNNGPVSVSR